MSKSRPIGIKFPSGTPTITLFYGTDDETSARIYAPKSDKPYAKMDGVTYYLTKNEIKNLRAMLGAFKNE